jgi:RNA recognition motif-containing protein
LLDLLFILLFILLQIHLQDQFKDKTVHKIFVGRITENLTKEDIKDHFETFGLVTDVYIPVPFRHFCFVQFSEFKVAQSLLGKEHLIKGVSVKIGSGRVRFSC